MFAMPPPRAKARISSVVRPAPGARVAAVVGPAPGTEGFTAVLVPSGPEEEAHGSDSSWSDTCWNDDSIEPKEEVKEEEQALGDTDVADAMPSPTSTQPQSLHPLRPQPPRGPPPASVLAEHGKTVAPPSTKTKTKTKTKLEGASEEVKQEVKVAGAPQVASQVARPQSAPQVASQVARPAAEGAPQVASQVARPQVAPQFVPVPQGVPQVAPQDAPQVAPRRVAAEATERRAAEVPRPADHHWQSAESASWWFGGWQQDLWHSSNAEVALQWRTQQVQDLALQNQWLQCVNKCTQARAVSLQRELDSHASELHLLQGVIDSQGTAIRCLAGQPPAAGAGAANPTVGGRPSLPTVGREVQMSNSSASRTRNTDFPVKLRSNPCAPPTWEEFVDKHRQTTGNDGPPGDLGWPSGEYDWKRPTARGPPQDLDAPHAETLESYDAWLLASDAPQGSPQVAPQGSPQVAPQGAVEVARPAAEGAPRSPQGTSEVSRPSCGIAPECYTPPEMSPLTPPSSPTVPSRRPSPPPPQDMDLEQEHLIQFSPI